MVINLPDNLKKYITYTEVTFTGTTFLLPISKYRRL